MRLNKKIITRIAVLSLPAVIPVCIARIALMTAWASGARWTEVEANSLAVIASASGMVAGLYLAVGLWPKS